MVDFGNRYWDDVLDAAILILAHWMTNQKHIIIITAPTTQAHAHRDVQRVEGTYVHTARHGRRERKQMDVHTRWNEEWRNPNNSAPRDPRQSRPWELHPDLLEARRISNMLGRHELYESVLDGWHLLNT